VRPDDTFTSGETDPRSPRAARAGLYLAAGAISLIVLAFAVYWPTLRYGFVGWDDDRNVIMNPMVVEPRGLCAIWTQVRGPAGLPNYPLFYTSFWLEYRLWAGNPTGYHATNIGLHALNAVLVLLLLRRLGLGPVAAWVCALLFTLHPMQVESVAWITERKNVLSGAFYLLAFLLYIRYRQTDRQAAYMLALLAYVAALLSKTASITLVLSLFLADCFVLTRGTRVTLDTVHAILRRLAPFISIGIVASLLLVAVEDRPTTTLSPVDRVLVAARAVWFYLGKLLWPSDLIPIYPPLVHYASRAGELASGDWASPRGGPDLALAARPPQPGALGLRTLPSHAAARARTRAVWFPQPLVRR
jgi:protein O-mannosyl-transferase